MRLRNLIFITLSGIAVLPVFALAGWIFVDALDQEIERVRDKHLVIARNVGEALDRYAIDLKNGFELIVGIWPQAPESPAVTAFLKSLNFEHVCIIDRETGVISAAIAPSGEQVFGRMPADWLKQLTGFLDGERTVFSGVMLDPAGRPQINLVKPIGDKLIVGAVSTRYIVRQGKTVSFGEKGHAAIVDQYGSLIAHPLPSWTKAAKNIARVAPVQRMMARETGTTVFYSPALKADMVTGYTFVPTTGWGVMVPQPLSEIRAAANMIQNSAIGVGAAGILAAAGLSWLLSGFLTRSLSSVVRTTRDMASGDYEARVATGAGTAPREFRELGQAFNAMADEIARKNRDLSEAVVQANFANRAKSEFLAIMSHDLRTPLNAIIGFSDAMRKQIFGPLGDKRYDAYLGDIEKSGNILLGLINDILDLSKIEAGRYELKESNVALDAFLARSVELASIQARQNGIALELSCAADLPMLRCDERSLMQIVNNLLSNAIKFSHADSSVRISAGQGTAGDIEIAVSDDGIGMTERDVKEVLQPFSQADSGKARKYEGTGLGLHICLKFMELHGGRLEIDSRVGSGTTATIRFPAERAVARLAIAATG